MKKLCLLAALSVWLALPAVAQSSTTQGQFNWSVLGFAPVGTPACQPGPAPTFPACALPAPSLGSPYNVVLGTVGLIAPITCKVASGSLPAWATLTSQGTTCTIAGTPTGTAVSNFTLSATGS
ncbi:MAG: hypothetical protein JWQ87_5444 [Candidatus Sulfotelmatobacter sp.]|nr:hypothetical protein [Candidatus Sulfotelmatobacter sp.]